MTKRVVTMVLVAALTGLWCQPAAASKLVALVVGNESPVDGASSGDLGARLAELKSSLFSYGNETYIIEGNNLPRAELAERIRRFEAGLEDAEIAIFYYSGIGAHDLAGNSYLVPQGWDGRQEEELIALGSVLEKMRINPKSRGLVFLDAVKPASASEWQPAVQPGLGSLGSAADGDKLQIASLEMMSGPAGSVGYLTRALLRQLQGERIKLPQFASLVQQDVSFDTASIHVPRLYGSLGGSLELQRLSKDELAVKQQRCLASRERNALDEPMLLGARPREASRTVFWNWFCPEPMARPTPDQPRSRQTRPDDREPAPTRRSTQRDLVAPKGERAAGRGENASRQGGTRGYSGGGAGGSHAAAASAAPTP